MEKWTSAFDWFTYTLRYVRRMPMKMETMRRTRNT
jgi:hypothetical protein